MRPRDGTTTGRSRWGKAVPQGREAGTPQAHPASWARPPHSPGPAKQPHETQGLRWWPGQKGGAPQEGM